MSPLHVGKFELSPGSFFNPNAIAVITCVS